jgi:hypothetical protein
MYKVLITTSSMGFDAKALFMVVVEFQTREEADTAVERVNSSKDVILDGWGKRVALALY